MTCARAEDALRPAAADMTSASAAAPAPVGGLIQKVGGGRRSGGLGRALQRSSHLSAADGESSAPAASCSGDGKGNNANGSMRREESYGGRMQNYRSELEQEVKKLQRQLEEEIDLHVALADVVTQNAAPMLKSSMKLPYKTQELLFNIASLESTVSNLEKELNDLYYQLCHERNERLLAENNPRCLPSTSPDDQSLSTCTCTWEEHISSLRDLKFGGSESMRSTQQDLFSELEYEQDVGEEPEDRQIISLNRLLEKHQDTSLNRLLEKHRDEEMEELCSMEKEGNEDKKMDALSFEQSILKMTSMKGGNLWNSPNQLSEQMVRCMRNIFLRLSESSKISPKASSDCSSSSAEHLSGSTLASFSDSSIIPSMLLSPSVNSNNDEIMNEIRNFDPYKVNGKESRRDIGSYRSVAEVSWMSVGKDQLEYASEALKKFRFLVEQLSKVNLNCMNSDERLAFWLNLYNALIMHAYLAYGVPRNDIKLFSLMQKACYTVGGQSFSAAEIEFVILKTKTPVHRPQLSLMLALNKFKITEEHKKYSIEETEPLVLFGLSCGMFSSPAVRIFSASCVRQELQESLRDYIQASVGINDRGKLLIPKLLQSYAKGTVEDSLLADWICHHLAPDQVAVIRDSSSQRKQRLLGARSFTVVAFDSKFRYLFLPDNSSSQIPELKQTS